MTELDFQLLARPEPSAIISGFCRQARSSWRSWRLCVRLFFGLDVTENEVAKQIVDAAYRVHTSLGPGLLESAYEAVLAYELEKRGLRTVRQQAVPIVYQGTRIEMGFRADLIVEDSVIVEIKSVEAIAPVHKKQLLTHLRLADKRLGLLINFNVALIKDGITRIANGMPD
jgi:GxxExxY protein